MSNLFSVQQVRMRYEGRVVLDIPELTIPSQGCTLLQGRNGSGKTTLLKILAGLSSPQHYRLILPDHSPLHKAAARRWLRQNVVYLHQQPYLFDATVFDNVAYGLRCQKRKRDEIQHIVDEALAWAELSHLSQRHAQCLSGGERQRVALTRARVLSPRLLLLDEPTASMDKEAREQTYFLLRRLQHENLSIILTSHELHEDSHLGQQRWFLENGVLSSHSLEANAVSLPAQPSASDLTYNIQ